MWQNRNKQQFGDWVGQEIVTTDPWIYPVAHTSLKGRANRSSDKQMLDWARIPELLNGK
jgi:hypothetical protein